MEEFLLEDPEIPEAQREFLLNALSFILHNNYFTYDGSIYHRERGTAMGTSVAPSSANLFIGCFEKEYIVSNHPFRSKILLFKRYIDDLFFLWRGDDQEAHRFVHFLNTNTWGIKFTPNFCYTEIEFLDVLISHDQQRYTTSTFFKKVDSNSYLELSSGHYHKWKRNIPFGQFRQVRTNCTEESMYQEQAKIISQRFREKGYPKGLIEDAYHRASTLTQEQCLAPKSKILENTQDRVNFITTHNKWYAKIQGVLRKHWHILSKDPYLKTFLTKIPQITYRRPPTPKNLLAPVSYANI